jgi:GT2 family glycosyltransferase
MDKSIKSNQSSTSIVILTMNRSNHVKKVLNNISLQSVLPDEIIIVDNASEEFHKLKNKRIAKEHNAKYFCMDINLGVSGGRNFGLRKAIGDIILEIDDDAEFESNDAIKKVVGYFENDESIGLLAFSIFKNKNFERRREEFPFFAKKRKLDNELIPCGWFIGAGHAFRGKIFEKIKYYNDFFPYGQEEIDLSLRVIDSGYNIFFAKEIKIFHYKTDDARYIPNIEIEALNLKNRVKVALLNLNVLSIFTYIVVRSLQYYLKCKTFKVITLAYSMMLNDLDYIKKNRKVISFKSYIKLIKVRGPILF